MVAQSCGQFTASATTNLKAAPRGWRSAWGFSNDCCRLIGWSCVAEMVTAATLVQHLGVVMQWPVFGGNWDSGGRRVDKSRKPIYPAL